MLWDMKVIMILIIIDVFEMTPKGLIRGLKKLEISRDHPKYCLVKISQNTEKSSGDLRRLVVTQTPMKDHQLMLE